MARFTYEDRRKHGHSPFWAWLITAANHPTFNFIFVFALGGLIAVTIVRLFS